MYELGRGGYALSLIVSVHIFEVLTIFSCNVDQRAWRRILCYVQKNFPYTVILIYNKESKNFLCERKQLNHHFLFTFYLQVLSEYFFDYFDSDPDVETEETVRNRDYVSWLFIVRHWEVEGTS